MSRVLLSTIVAHASQTFGVPIEIIHSHKRHAAYCRARQAVFYLAARMTNHSLVAIGRRMGRDHSTVKHGIRQCENYMGRDPEYRAYVDAVAIRSQRKGIIRRVMDAERIQARQRVDEAAQRELTAQFGAMLASLPEYEAPKPPPEWWELSDEELLERKIAAYRAKGGTFVEVRA